MQYIYPILLSFISFTSISFMYVLLGAKSVYTLASNSEWIFWKLTNFKLPWAADTKNPSVITATCVCSVWLMWLFWPFIRRRSFFKLHKCNLGDCPLNTVLGSRCQKSVQLHWNPYCYGLCYEIQLQLSLGHDFLLTYVGFFLFLFLFLFLF